MITRGDEKSGALFSEDLTMRYKLWRRWDDGPVLAVIGLNPSTADEAKSDPTVGKCVRHAVHWGLNGLMMLNIFPYRQTDPYAMKKAINMLSRADWIDSISANRKYIADEVFTIEGQGGAILAAWGNHGSFHNESDQTRRLLDGHHVACLGITQSGQPRHPLYVPMVTSPIAFLGDGGRLCR